MIMKKLYSIFASAVLVAASFGAMAATASARPKDADKSAATARVRQPLNIAVLVQDDLVSRVGNELKVTRDFIRSLPAGSRVMVGYITSGTLQIRQPFTTDFDAAARALRLPTGSSASAPYSPYLEVRDAIKQFPTDGPNRNAVLLISDGLDTSRGFDASSTIFSLDLDRAVRAAKSRNVAVYSFYAPTVGLTSQSLRAVNYGQSALNRISDETGGRAFFQGTSFVTFDAYFERLTKTLNERSGAY